MTRGVLCTLGTETPKVGNDNNTVRGEVIRFFAFGGDEKHFVRGSYIKLLGAWICGEGALNLQHANIPYALGLFNCHFDIGVDIMYAKCTALYLDGSNLTQGLDADGLTTKGSVHMREKFSSNGEVRTILLGANIGGYLDCQDGKFDNPKGYALNADGLTVKCCVFLRRNFSSKGEVRLLDANIGGEFNCARWKIS